jgi:hypothetical protein
MNDATIGLVKGGVQRGSTIGPVDVHTYVGVLSFLHLLSTIASQALPKVFKEQKANVMPID